MDNTFKMGWFVNAYKNGQVDKKTALGREWLKITLKSADGEVRDEEYWKEHYPHKFNMLFSEDLY